MMKDGVRQGSWKGRLRKCWRNVEWGIMYEIERWKLRVCV